MSVFRSGRKSHCSGWSIDDFLLFAFGSEFEDCHAAGVARAIFSTSQPLLRARIAVFRRQACGRAEQSRVLTTEGERLLWICQAQREALGLRILSVGGVAPLDKRAITVLSLDPFKLMANGQLTKIIFPFKVSQLIRQGAKFLVIKETAEGRYRTPRDG